MKRNPAYLRLGAWLTMINLMAWGAFALFATAIPQALGLIIPFAFPIALLLVFTIPGTGELTGWYVFASVVIVINAFVWGYWIAHIYTSNFRSDKDS